MRTTRQRSSQTPFQDPLRKALKQCGLAGNSEKRVEKSSPGCETKILKEAQ